MLSLLLEIIKDVDLPMPISSIKCVFNYLMDWLFFSAVSEFPH